ncbi:DUF7793 family protein [Sunxiuqinia sp. A32]|uniref:DUF7793 family protein n=1 Tax=Sunxiuqinia sp. A32 TaxID=3461496 RepID=UPI0040459006
MIEQLSIQKTKKQELVVGNNIVSVMPGNIIHVIAIGEQTTAIAIAQDKLNRQLAKSFTGSVNYLIDLNRARKNSPEARKLWKKVVEDETTHKVALYGIHPVARVLAQFVMVISKGGNIRFFKTKEEGLMWIKE